MKLSGWQWVVALPVLLAAPICAQVFAPGVAVAVAGMASTAFAFFAERKQ